MSIKHFPFLIAGEATTTDSRIEIRNSFDGRIVATVSEADPVHIESAIAAARRWPPNLSEYTRAYPRRRPYTHINASERPPRGDCPAYLSRIRQANQVGACRGYPRRYHLPVGSRGGQALEWITQRLDTDAGSDGRLALVHRVPRGPIPRDRLFNFPLNLVAHKAAGKLAVGAPIIVKPAPATPLSSLVLGELLAETSLLEGAWSVLTASNEKASEMVQDPRLPVAPFTGSVPGGVGHPRSGAAKTRHARIGRKRRRGV